MHSRHRPKGGKTSVSDIPFTTNSEPKSPPTPKMADAMMQQVMKGFYHHMVLYVSITWIQLSISEHLHAPGVV